jgi:hypothetical protein
VSLDAQGGAQLFDETLDGELAVAQLAALVLGDCPEHWTETGDDTVFLRLAERRRGGDVERCFDPRRRLLGVLSTGTARPRESQLDLGEG